MKKSIFIFMLMALNICIGCRNDEEQASLFDNMEVFTGEYCIAGIVLSVDEQTVKVVYLGLSSDYHTHQPPKVYVIFNRSDLSQEYTLGQVIQFKIMQRRVEQLENDEWEQWYCKVEEC